MGVGSSITILHGSGACPTGGSGSYPNGSCCFKWNATENDWEFVSSSCAQGHICPRGDEGVEVEPQHDNDYIRVPCIQDPS